MSDLPVFTRIADERIVELQARVAELESELSDWISSYNYCECGHPRCSIESNAKIGREVLSRKPPQSLKLHDAEVLKGFQSKLLSIIDGTENDPDERHKWYSAVCRILGLEIQNKKWEAEKVK